MNARRRLIAVGIALAAAGTAAALALRHDDAGPKVVVRPNSVVALDPAKNRFVQTFTAGRVPTAAATGADAVWVLNSLDRTVSRIDPGRGAVQTFPIGSAGGRVGLAVDRTGGWVAAGTVYRFGARSLGAITLPLPERGAARLVALSPRAAWLIGGRRYKKLTPHELTKLLRGPPRPFRLLAWRVDPRTNTVTRTAQMRAGVLADSPPWNALIAGDSLWLRSGIGIARFDQYTGAFKSQVRLSTPATANAGQPGGFIAAAGSLWASDIGRGLVWRIDLDTGKPIAKIPVRQPAGIAFGAGAVWIADAEGSILRLDPDTNEIVKRIPVNGVPSGLAFGSGRLWIAID